MKSYVGSIIYIDFPNAYDIQSSVAYLDNIPYTNLQNSSTASKISYSTPTTTRFKIQNFAPVIKGQRVSLGIFSIKNPVSGSYTITISITDSSNNII